MNEFDPDYPHNPQSLGEKLRKTRMDKGLYIRELAEYLKVTEDTVINWELRGIRPQGSNLEAVKRFIEKRGVG